MSGINARNREAELTKKLSHAVSLAKQVVAMSNYISGIPQSILDKADRIIKENNDSPNLQQQE